MHVVVIVDGAIQFLLNHIVTNSDASTYDAFTRAPVRSANSIVLAADEDDVTGTQQNFCCKTWHCSLYDWSSLTFSTRISERNTIHSLLFDILVRFGSRRSSDHRTVTPCSRFHRQSRSWRLRLADWHRANHDLCRYAHFRSRSGTRHYKLKNRSHFRTF